MSSKKKKKKKKNMPFWTNIMETINASLDKNIKHLKKISKHQPPGVSKGCCLEVFKYFQKAWHLSNLRAVLCSFLFKKLLRWTSMDRPDLEHAVTGATGARGIRGSLEVATARGSCGFGCMVWKGEVFLAKKRSAQFLGLQFSIVFPKFLQLLGGLEETLRRLTHFFARRQASTRGLETQVSRPKNHPKKPGAAKTMKNKGFLLQKPGF